MLLESLPPPGTEPQPRRQCVGAVQALRPPVVGRFHATEKVKTYFGALEIFKMGENTVGFGPLLPLPTPPPPV